MTTTETRWYVARQRGTDPITIKRCFSKDQATLYANHLYRSCGVTGPLVVAAPNVSIATAKAARVLIDHTETTRWASNPKTTA